MMNCRKMRQGTGLSVNQMKIARMRQMQGANDGSRKAPHVAESQSRAIVAVQDPAGAKHASSRTYRVRRTAAFLAHLALQYDGVSVRRQQRAERLDAAISSYGKEAVRRNALHWRPTRDLKI